MGPSNASRIPLFPLFLSPKQQRLWTRLFTVRSCWAVQQMSSAIILFVAELLSWGAEPCITKIS